MLIKVTNKCSMGCSHCMERSVPGGPHMTREVFLRALDCSDRVEVLARQIGYNAILLSGGECTEHPDILWFIEQVYARGLQPMLLSNGLWLADPELRAAILRPEWPSLLIQVTNDPRFYPKRPPIESCDDPRVVFIPSLSAMIPLGRYVGKTSDVPTKKVPSSFNFRSLTRTHGDLRLAIAHLRMIAMTGRGGNCAPSISYDGAFIAGETNACFKVGTVDSSPEELTQGVLAMQCNRCHLEDGLTQEQKRAIGASRLYAAGESSAVESEHP